MPAILTADDYLPLIRMARREDYGDGDLTAQLVDRHDVGVFRLIAKEPCVMAGQAVAAAVLQEYDRELRIVWSADVADGTRVEGPVPKTLAEIQGAASPIVSCERVLLNFLQRLCGIATETARYVAAVGPHPARILDTRKTLPAWRALDRYAVRCGGGKNHRKGLYDAVLLKDNHLAGVPVSDLAAFLFHCLNRLSELTAQPSFIEVEVDSLDQFDQAIKVVGIDVIMLDNFTTADLSEAVRRRDDAGLAGKVSLEASGRMTLDRLPEVAATGVEAISVGAITHSARAVDLSLERL